jgi:cellulose synthase/poly-beta-1,6-N-acetylglucosamine synthase-like glycosyltransferase
MPLILSESRLRLYAPYIILTVILAFFCAWCQSSNPALVLFWLAFGWKSIRISLVTIGQLLQAKKQWVKTPAEELLAELASRYKAKDVTIRLSTVWPENEDFEECLQGVFRNRPGRLDIVTDTRSRAEQVQRIVQSLDTFGVEVRVASAGKANKRLQMIYLIDDVVTPLIAYLDDRSILLENFFENVLPVFNDPDVALCGTTKRVRRVEPRVSGRFRFLKWYWKSFWNFEGAAYLERHNFEFLATEAIDGGHYVISGRTMLGRTTDFQDTEFRHKFMNENKGFLGFNFGPLVAGDDNYITRWVSCHGHKIVFTDAATIETTLGESASKIILQFVRWKRTTIQNADVIFELLYPKPWTTPTIIGMLLSGAIFWDSLQVYLFWKSSSQAYRWLFTGCFLGFIWLTKFYKLVLYFRRRPENLIFFPPHLLFVYFHNLITIYACFTFWVCSWSGRTLGTGDEEETGWLQG